MTQSILEIIESDIKTNDIVLYMKGTRDMPKCGFSASVSALLVNLEVPFKDVNVLKSHGMRQGIKEYADWATIPQLYIKGEFIGGCDIIKEMHQKGELHDLLEEKGLLRST